MAEAPGVGRSRRGHVALSQLVTGQAQGGGDARVAQVTSDLPVSFSACPAEARAPQPPGRTAAAALPVLRELTYVCRELLGARARVCRRASASAAWDRHTQPPGSVTRPRLRSCHVARQSSSSLLSRRCYLPCSGCRGEGRLTSAQACVRKATHVTHELGRGERELGEAAREGCNDPHPRTLSRSVWRVSDLCTGCDTGVGLAGA